MAIRRALRQRERRLSRARIAENQCESKWRYETKGEALRACRKLGKVKRNDKKKFSGMIPYRCRCCSAWHVGHHVRSNGGRDKHGNPTRRFSL